MHGADQLAVIEPLELALGRRRRGFGGWLSRVGRQRQLTVIGGAVRGGALRFRRLTGISRRDLLREGLAMRRSQDLSWSQLVMAANAPMLTKAAMVDGHVEVGILPTGQCVGVVDDLPTCRELIARMAVEAGEALDRFAVPVDHHR